ncbi:MAG: NmrA family NAD(P)-binding protein [Bacteroidetes bacterium]|nr:NmrA family NAD(P)-binding protein [Bacteroidota bacterium]
MWNGPTAAQQGLNFLAAMDRAGATPHIVRHSAFGVDESRLIQQIDQVDDAVKASGRTWTILKPTFYMQNTMMLKDSIANDGMIYWDWNDAKAGMIDLRDIADCAFSALTQDGHEGQSYILTGPESVSWHEMATAIGSAIGKEVKYMSVPHEAAKESMVGFGMSEWIVDGYIELNHGFESGFADISNDNVEKLSGHPARSIQDFANDFGGYFTSN